MGRSCFDYLAKKICAKCGDYSKLGKPLEDIIADAAGR